MIRRQNKLSDKEEEQRRLGRYWGWYAACETCRANAQAPCVDLRTLKAGKHKPQTLSKRHPGRHRFSKAERREHEAKRYAEARVKLRQEIAFAKALLEELPTFESY